MSLGISSISASTLRDSELRGLGLPWLSECLPRAKLVSSHEKQIRYEMESDRCVGFNSTLLLADRMAIGVLVRSLDKDSYTLSKSRLSAGLYVVVCKVSVCFHAKQVSWQFPFMKYRPDECEHKFQTTWYDIDGRANR